METNKFEQLLSVLVEQNNTLIEENSQLKNMLKETNKKFEAHFMRQEEQQTKLNNENTKLYTHFAEEFVHLRKSIDNMLMTIQQTSSVYSMPNLATVDAILNFDIEIKDSDNIKNLLVSFQLALL